MRRERDDEEGRRGRVLHDEYGLLGVRSIQAQVLALDRETQKACQRMLRANCETATTLRGVSAKLSECTQHDLLIETFFLSVFADTASRRAPTLPSDALACGHARDECGETHVSSSRWATWLRAGAGWSAMIVP